VERPNGASTPQVRAYPETADGLHDLMQRLATAIQKGDSEQGTALVHSLIIPHFGTWFPQVFGAEIGARVAHLYEESIPDFDAKFKERIEGLVKEGRTDIGVTRFQAPEVPEKDFYAVKLVKAMQNPVSIYAVKMNKLGETARSIPGFFVFEEGSFRYIGWHALGGVPNLLPTRIRVSGNVQAAKMVHMVMPKYPHEAKAQKVQGTEVLHTVIDCDGSILDLQWVGGPPELRDAAMDAVKQWRYQPTLLNGEPMQVDTTINVVFTLGKKVAGQTFRRMQKTGDVAFRNWMFPDL
jgi:TonB family protein